MLAGGGTVGGGGGGDGIRWPGVAADGLVSLRRRFEGACFSECEDDGRFDRLEVVVSIRF